MIEDIVLEFTDPSELVMETDRPFDLLDDTVSEATVLSGYRFHRPDGQVAYGECTYDCDTSAGTATPDDIANGKKAYSHGREVVGTHTTEISSFVNAKRSCANRTLRPGNYDANIILYQIGQSELKLSSEKDIYIPYNSNITFSSVAGPISASDLRIEKVLVEDDQYRISGIKIITRYAFSYPAPYTGSMKFTFNISSMYSVN